MGNLYSYFISQNIPQGSPEYTNNDNSIEDRIKELEKQLDANRDNIVTRDELESYFNQLSNNIDKNSDGIITKKELEIYVNQQLQTTNAEIEKWKTAYENLKEEYDRIVGNNNNTELPNSSISIDSIKKYIKDEIINTDANLRFVPDPIEKKIYLTVYKSIMKSLEALFRTTTVDLVNHRIGFHISPIEEDKI